MRAEEKERNLSTQLLWVLVASACAACASAPLPTPKQRYIEAVNHKLAGDAERSTDTLLALAHDAKDTRAGRRARATLTGGGLTGWASLATLATLAGSFLQSEGSGSKGPQEEPGGTLQDLYRAQTEFSVKHQRYCRTFDECQWS